MTSNHLLFSKRCWLFSAGSSAAVGSELLQGFWTAPHSPALLRGQEQSPSCGRMLRAQLWSSNGKVSISVVSTLSESHDTQTMKHRKSHPLEINSTMRAQSMQFFHCSDCTQQWKQQVENLGFRKAEAATKQEPKFDLVLVHFYNERINRSGNTTTCRLCDLAFTYKSESW